MSLNNEIYYSLLNFIMSSSTLKTKQIKNLSKKKKPFRYELNSKKENRDIILIVLALYTIGLIFILSSSSANLVVKNQDPFYYVKKQLVFGCISLIPFCFAYFIKIENILKYDKLIFAFSILLSLLVLLIGKEVNGNRNWLSIGPIGIQPSEFIKLSLIVCSSIYLKTDKISFYELKRVFPICILLIGLIGLQGDLGTVIIMCGVACLLLFVAGTPFKILAGIGFSCACALASAIILAPHRVKRFLIFTDPFSDYYGTGYQTVQSLYAIANGKIFGRGIYESIQKYGFLPESHTDFIFSIITEEMGIIGALILLSLFILLISKILKIAYSLKEKKYTLIVCGIGSLIAIETLINLSVTVSLMPVAGVTLPFISYGGSSLMSKATAIALVLNINKNCSKLDYETINTFQKEDKLIKQQYISNTKQKVKSTRNVLYNKIKISVGAISFKKKTIDKINTSENNTNSDNINNDDYTKTDYSINTNTPNRIVLNEDATSKLKNIKIKRKLSLPSHNKGVIIKKINIKK